MPITHAAVACRCWNTILALPPYVSPLGSRIDDSSGAPVPHKPAWAQFGPSAPVTFGFGGLAV